MPDRDLIGEARALDRQRGPLSTPDIQRSLRIGYNQAARIRARLYEGTTPMQQVLPTFPIARYADLEEIARLAVRVRAAQRVYFTHRSHTYLAAAKIEEAKLDAALAALPPLPPRRAQ